MSSWLRIAVVQFAPKIGEVHANIAKARALCLGLTPRSVDLVCFPEMIFTGYMFPDAASIAPYLEHPRTGQTASFCAELARRLGCLVVAGVPVRLESASPTPSPTSAATTPIGANAGLLYSPSGLEHVYHKSNLFPTDRTWARAGPGFVAWDVPGLGRVAVGICNDVNVSEGEWTSIEEGPYELGTWCREEGVGVLVLLNAWLKHEDGDADEDGDRDDVSGEEDGLEPNWEVLRYWAMRLRPLWTKDGHVEPVNAPTRTDVTEDTRSIETSADGSARAGKRDVIVICCNRFGRERGKTFVGSSAMFAMRQGSGRPKLLHAMGEREEGVCVWTAKLDA